MRCKEAQNKSSAYLDGDLSDEQSSAVRGHLRQCKACEHLFEQEAAILEASANLAPLEPPDRIWDAIANQIAEAEIADSDTRAWWRWVRDHGRPLGAIGAAMAVAAAALFLTRSGAREPTGASSARVAELSPGALPTASEGMPVSVIEQQQLALTEADRDYQQTIEELRAMLEEDRQGWSAPVAAAVDARLASFRNAAIKGRFARADEPLLVSSRDPIYASYRAEISFLQAALVGELPAEGLQP